MKFQRKQKHMIDLLFPVALFSVFALCALTVLLLSARIYRSITETSSLNDTARTGLSYVSEKIHQNDAGGKIHLGKLNGTDALIMEQDYEGSVYYTYIYSYENTLRELFVKEGVKAELSAGTKILDLKSFSMKEMKENLFQFECVTKDGKTDSVLVAVKSKE